MKVVLGTKSEVAVKDMVPGTTFIGYGGDVWLVTDRKYDGETICVRLSNGATSPHDPTTLVNPVAGTWRQDQ